MSYVINVTRSDAHSTHIILHYEINNILSLEEVV